MDSTNLNDVVFECIRAVVLVGLLLILFFRGSLTTLGRHPGWKLILAGFCLITAATLIDITDEIPGLEKYVIIGDTIYESFIEKVPGYLFGFSLLLLGFYQMIPSLLRFEEQEQALQQSEERLRQIFVANPDPVILGKLESGAIIDVNPAFEEQTGFQRAEVLGKNSGELDVWSSPEQREHFRNQLKQTGAIDNFEEDFRLKDGRLIPGLLSARVIRVGDEPCILIVIRDISKIREAERALVEIDRMKSEFVSTAAHELRTPMTSLIGFAELLTDPETKGALSDEQKQDFLNEIREKGFELSRLVDDLLDLSRIEAGLKFRLQLEELDPVPLLRKSFEQFQSRHPRYRFDLVLPQTGGTRLKGDSQRLVQVLENLLTNAVKYSAVGSRIQLACRYTPDQFSFAVTDNGRGMTEEQCEKVFDMFYRVDSSDTAVAGLGLGLNIVKQIVTGHNGCVGISSRAGQGTEVTVTLPLQQPASDQLPG